MNYVGSTIYVDIKYGIYDSLNDYKLYREFKVDYKSFDNDTDNSEFTSIDIGFILSDDKPLEQDLPEQISRRSLGDIWLQGHLAIAICHFLIDEGVDLNI